MILDEQNLATYVHACMQGLGLGTLKDTYLPCMCDKNCWHISYKFFCMAKHLKDINLTAQFLLFIFVYVALYYI